jgi:NADH-quinone oxidoreductase subunit L
MDSLLSLPLLPLIGALICFALQKKKSNHALSGWVATAAVASSFVVALRLFLSGLGISTPYTQVYWEWMRGVEFGFHFDRIASVMTLLVCGVGALIHLYAIGYMKEDTNRARFFSYLNLFVASMLVLILGSSLPVLFIGWEGVGICSFLLIGFWRENREFGSAASKAFIMNRIGDAGLLFGMGILYYSCGTLDIQALGHLYGAIPYFWLVIAGLVMFLGVAGKSAQIPLYTWLPDAMAGPTPVSALIHAATMVTAGIYLMARMDWLFAGVPEVSAVGVIIGIATCAVAGLTAIAQNDIKKVLAYSTVSQLGLMVAGAASGVWIFAIFHVITHAFFKATLFLGAGSVIHGCHHEQDMRKMGGLISKMPLTAICFLVATVAISGIAPLSGYYSKHGIIEGIHHANLIAPWILTALTLLTAVYMGRAFGMTFLGAYRGTSQPHEVSKIMWMPVAVLGLCSIVAGFLLNDIISIVLAGETNTHLATTQSITFSKESVQSMVATAQGVAPLLGNIGHEIASSLPALCALLVGILLGATGFEEVVSQLKILSTNFYLDVFYREILIKKLWSGFARICGSSETLVFEEVANGIGSTVEAVSEGARTIQSGSVNHYALGMLLGAIVLVGVYILG